MVTIARHPSDAARSEFRPFRRLLAVPTSDFGGNLGRDGRNGAPSGFSHRGLAGVAYDARIAARGPRHSPPAGSLDSGWHSYTRSAMPIYEYRCERGHTFEVMQRMTDDPLASCSTCGAPVQRVFHPVAVHFKG